MKLDKLLNGADPMDVLSFEPYVISLECGDIVIADVAAIDDDNYCMIVPFRLFESEEDNGKITVACIKMVPGSDDIFYHLAADKVVTMGTMSDAMFEFYKKNVDSFITKSGVQTYVSPEDDNEPDPTPGGNVVLFRKPKQLH